jgi:hypothetical protein
MEELAEGQRRGFWIRIFLADGSSSGLKVVEKSNWSGRGVVCPRPRFGAVKHRAEFNRAGVYVLIGPSESSDAPTAYIGEGDPLLGRLERQHAERDFWTVVYFFTSKDGNLNKAHIEYLEHRLISIARETKRSRLDNTNMPGRPSLSEADQAEVETFLEEMLLCFPVLGVSIFEMPEQKPVEKLVLTFTRRALTARGYESEDGFVVIKGSQASNAVVDSMQPYASELRDRLIRTGVLKDVGSHLEFGYDYEFTSPSTAASIVAGASVNGRDYWRATDGRTLKQLQEAESSI